MKFWKLLKKEIREIVTIQSLVGVVISIVAFMLLGNVMGNIGKEMSEKMGSVVVCDADQSEISKQVLTSIEQQGTKIYYIQENSPVELMKDAFAYEEHTSVVIIPKGFGDGIQAGNQQEVELVTALKSFAMLGGTDSSAEMAATTINQMVSDMLLSQTDGSVDVDFLKTPVSTTETTVVGENYEAVSSAMLSAFAMQQSMFVPIIVFILITFATQLNSAAIANEKNDKTLETLLSAPVSRLAVLSSKMCASGIFSLLMAGVYMIGFSSYMGGMMSGVTGGEAHLDGAMGGAGNALANLGLQMGLVQFVLLGIQLFLTIMIALAISMILGALAKDVKSAQSLTMPMMFMTMIPYFVTMFVDVNGLPLIGKILMNIIPFTHTFTASANLLFGNMTLFFGGMIYQIIVLAIVLFAAVRIFSSDKIFTMTLEFGKKKKKTVKNVE